MLLQLSMKTCNSCAFPKHLDEFGSNKNEPDGKQKYCKVCSRLKDKKHYKGSSLRRFKIRERNQDSRKRHQQLVIDYLSAHPCIDCGEDDIICLDFDHVNGVKRCNVAEMITWGEEAINAEIAKCVVRCANCHRRKTSRECGWFKSVHRAGTQNRTEV